MNRTKRATYAYLGMIVGVGFIVALSYGLPLLGQDNLASILVGKVRAGAPGLPFPFTIQNIMWIMFFVAFGELLYRKQEIRAAQSYLAQNYLPADKDNTVLQVGELTPIFTKVKDKIADDAAMLPKMIYQTILQFQNTKSIDNAANLVNSQMEYLSHQLDLKYTMLRYLVWLIPTLGFIGTVYGIALTLANLDAKSADLLTEATKNLAVAFDTTLLALIQSALLVYVMYITQEKEERCLNLSGQDCLNNLVNRLYVRAGA